MENRKKGLENSLLKISSSNASLRNYLKGWEESLKNFNDIFKEEWPHNKLRDEQQMNCLVK